MESSIDEMLGQRLLLAFEGRDQLPSEIQKALREFKPGGITLYRHLNITDPQQVKLLTLRLQSAAAVAGLPPLLIAVDQEGGQLMAIGEGTTPLPGNMALGAAGSDELSRRAGEVLGRELAAMGINVNYAPCCDVNVNPENPVIGVRSFGEDPNAVSRLASAMVGGIQSAGVAATAKHFPGHGDTSTDSHAGLPTVSHSRERLDQIEFPPFRSAIAAGTKLVMTAHIALPAIDGPNAPAATMSPQILGSLLRRHLRFEGVIVSDAMDMQGFSRTEELGGNAVRAVNAGVDLLLLPQARADQERVYSSLLAAAKVGALGGDGSITSAERILALKRWLKAQPAPDDLSGVGSPQNQEVAAQIAARSVTLIRDQKRVLPLHLGANDRVVVVTPKPVDLTPADTSSSVRPTLAGALRKYHSSVDELVIPHQPPMTEIHGLVERLEQYDVIVIGTINAEGGSGQAALVQKASEMGKPMVVIGMRLPYELAAFPEIPTYLCTYSILEPSMRAAAAAIFGETNFQGKLPVSVPGLYPLGHSETR